MAKDTRLRIHSQDVGRPHPHTYVVAALGAAAKGFAAGSVEASVEASVVYGMAALRKIQDGARRSPHPYCSTALKTHSTIRSSPQRDYL